ncbi:hypothetical protein I100019A1_32920 [Phocaeicola vulgatus]|jgi:hypothetical protein|nr:hypothetical protein GAIMETA21S03_34160 [Phocaeicola vulgatus]BDC11546.1 hypothetical protein GAIMETA21S07_33340 [Phocaeicola vulgatus]BDC15714.1 hypothetical protein GAIMETA21S10_34780 [Phocaeicola vulgatus]
MASMHLVAGIPKIRNGTNVAASRRLDSEADISIDRSNTGIRKELMPNAKPIAKNIMPTKARGTMKFFCEVFIIIG